MKLRTQISLLLFLFGLLPLFAALLINVPMIFESIESLYHKAYLQKLRAGFSDLDQHIARRHEIVRLLAKFPEPGMLQPADSQYAADTLDTMRTGYVEWLNQVFNDQLDIIRVIFMDGAGRISYWLERNNNTGQLEQGEPVDGIQNPGFIEAGTKLQSGSVLTGPIVFDHEAAQSEPNKFMQLGLISPIVTISLDDPGKAGIGQGVVIVYMDVGGLASAYRGLYWAYNDGHYLGWDEDAASDSSAFDDFPGLQQLFGKGELDLWEYRGQQILWLPLFATEKSGPLWVGRSVDPSPIAKLRDAIQLRVATIVFGLLVVVFVVARLIGLRGERLGKDLADGISRVLEHNEVVNFSWRRPEELRKLGKNMTRLAETNAEHSRALLEHARELEESNRYKSEFLANVSHELRTPLNSILLLSKMLADEGGEKQTGEERKQARVIHDAGRDLRALIDNILDLSRIEARGMSLDVEHVDLRGLLGDILELLRPQFEEKGLTLALEIDAAAPESILIDREKLRQILVNFLSNAVKFTERGGAVVRLECAGDRFDGKYFVCISVADTGIGILRDKQDKVFEAFKQADGSTSRRFGGTGLGLAISQELARLMGGEITIDSTPGEGSTFFLLLPEEVPHLPEGDEKPAPVSERKSREAGTPVPVADYRGARVLVVDDDVRNLLALTPLLERWGLEVMAAGDGQEALDTLESAGDFNVVLMDIMMPGMDGYEVIRRVRRQAAFEHLPVIALTARAGEEDRRNSLAAGASDYLAKPVEVQDLKEMLDKYLVGSDARHKPEGDGGTAS